MKLSLSLACSFLCSAWIYSFCVVLSSTRINAPNSRNPKRWLFSRFFCVTLWSCCNCWPGFLPRRRTFCTWQIKIQIPGFFLNVSSIRVNKVVRWSFSRLAIFDILNEQRLKSKLGLSVFWDFWFKGDNMEISLGRPEIGCDRFFSF